MAEFLNERSTAMTPSQKLEDEVENLRTKILVAGAGALIPLVANLYVVDATVVFQKFTWAAFAGYLFKALGMFATGCLLGYLNKSETKLKNYFVVGLSVPSLLVGIVNGSQYAKQEQSNQTRQNAAGPPSGKSFFRPAAVYAGSVKDKQPLKVFSLPEESTKEQFLRGLGISSSYRGFFVIAGAYLSKDDADTAAALAQQRGFPGVVYAPPPQSKTYAVVIGEQKTSQEAGDILKTALGRGLQGAFTWRLGDRTPIPPTLMGLCVSGATDPFSLYEREIHQASFEPTLYIYASAVHDSLKKATVYAVTAQAGSYPASGVVKNFDKLLNQALSYKKLDGMKIGARADYSSAAGKTYRITLGKAYHVKGVGDRADLAACLVL